jgi:hypothetical protein
MGARAISAGVVCVALAASSVARAESVASADTSRVEWMPGSSREIARAVSASRDAPVSTLVFGPRVRAMPAADFAFAKLSLDGVALRFGMDGFIDLEHADTGYRGLPLPGRGNGPMLWRGVYRASLALSAERLARAWLGRGGAIEIAMTVGHESDHVTGASFDDAPRRGDIVAGGGGEFAIYEAALRAPLAAKVDVWGRAQDRAYFRGAIFHAPGLEGGVRWRAWPHLWPTFSVFGEGLLVNPNLNGARDGWFVAALVGLALRGTLGEVMPFVSTDAGNGKGLLINRREVRVSIGVRYAPF